MGNENWMRAREALLDTDLHRRPRPRLPDLHARQLRHRPLRRGARAAPPRRLLAPPRRADDDPGGLGEPRVDAGLEARLLPLPRVADGAVGRPRVDRVHRRHRDRRRARPQRPPSEPLLGHRRRPRGDGVRGRRAADRPVHRRAEGPPPARPHVPHRHQPRPHRRRRRDQGGAGRPAALRRVAPRRARAPRRPPGARLPHAAARVGGEAPAGVRVHHRGAEGAARADGAHRRRADRVDGHRHAGRRAVGSVAPAVRLLPAALRAGHQPAARRHPRGARHLDGRHHRPRGQPAAARARRRAGRWCSPTRSSPTTSWPSSSTSTTTTTCRASSPSPSTACSAWPRAATACGGRSTTCAPR